MVVRETSTVEKGFLSKMRKTGRRLVVFYGSQTGTAEEFAGRLAKEGARYGLKGIVADPEEENMEVTSQGNKYFSCDANIFYCVRICSSSRSLMMRR